MGLPALEFSECYLDGPHFRERLRSHEEELDKTSKFIKELLKDGKALIQALRGLSAAERKFADSLNHFRFQCIGDAETDHEMCIASSLQEFAAVLQNLEEERSRMIENASQVLILPLERFRKDQISAAKEAKKRYDKETEKYCGVLEKHLSLSARRKEAQLQEADSQVEAVRQQFYQVSLDYVFKVQEVQERKMFDFVEPLLSFLQGLFTHYHHGYELAKDFSHFQTHLTISIQNTRNRFESTRSEVEGLMKKMKENPEEHKNVRQNVMEGYLFIQEKRSFVSSWVKYYCTYQREPRRVTMVTFDPRASGKLGEQESFILRSCTRRKSDSIEKRFCFDVEAEDRPGVITIQAPSEEERRLWMEAMEGQEPVYNLNKDNQAEGTQLDLVGFNVMKKFIYAVETRGLEEQGLYRLVGVTSKVQRLLSLAMDSKTCADVDLEGPEWEIKTITSAIKHYLRMLPAPLMTYQYQRSFIKAAKLDQQEDRVTEVHALVHRLPEKNRQMLELLMRHLATVAQHQQKNLMTVANLGVVFGPTLLRAQQETVAAIMDIKFQNIVVEILIQHQHRIFQDAPCAAVTDAAAMPADPATDPQQLQSRRRSCDNRAPSCSERPLTLFHTPTHSQRGEKRISAVPAAAASELQPLDCSSTSSSSGGTGGGVSSNSNSSCTSSCSSSAGGGCGGKGRSSRLSLTSNDGELEGRLTRPTSLLNPKSRCSAPTSAPSPPSPSSPSPSWPMFSAPSSPQPASSDSSPLRANEGSHPASPPNSGEVPGNRRARALYACKAEHDSELSFIAGCIFQQVHASREPGWLEGSLDGRRGLIPENYVEFLS